MSLTRSTDSIRPQDLERKWYVLDIEGIVLGKAAVQIADTLRGKNKPTFTPHTDTGDFVVVINASKVKLTGRKMDQKMYRHHTGFSGGLKEKSARQMVITKPDEMIRRAVWGMLPKGPLGRQMLKKLKVYEGSEHTHEAQKPEVMTL